MQIKLPITQGKLQFLKCIFQFARENQTKIRIKITNFKDVMDIAIIVKDVVTYDDSLDIITNDDTRITITVEKAMIDNKLGFIDFVFDENAVIEIW